MTESKTEKTSNVIWNFFSSVKLTITLLIILAIASIVGTIIPQQEGELHQILVRIGDLRELRDITEDSKEISQKCND